MTEKLLESKILHGVYIAAMVILSGSGTTWVSNQQTAGHQADRISAMELQIDRIAKDISATKQAINEIRASTMSTHNARRIAAIVQGIAQLDRDDREKWTTSGRPRVSALESMLRDSGRVDWQITSGERDLACVLSDICKR
jgi:hypothetical protein